MVRIDAIKADGQDLKYDANKFHYGDLEGKGNYRIELFNIWGTGTAQNSPFRANGGPGEAGEPALAFNKTLEVTFTVASTTSDGTGVYTPTFNAVRGWGEGEAQLWGYNDGSTLKVVKSDKGQYSIENNQFDMTYEGSGFEGGTIMTSLRLLTFMVSSQAHTVLWMSSILTVRLFLTISLRWLTPMKILSIVWNCLIAMLLQRIIVHLVSRMVI